MFALTKEHRYLLTSGMENLVLRVEESICGAAAGLKSFKLQLTATPNRPAKTFYGDTADGVAEEAAAYITEENAPNSHRAVA